jgi:hypothetical protein
MNIIKVTVKYDNKSIYINMDRVVSFRWDDETHQTWIFEEGDSGDNWEVLETPEEIMQLIKLSK